MHSLLLPSHAYAITHMLMHVYTTHNTKTLIPAFWLPTTLMQPEAEATVLTQPLCFSLLASYSGSTKLRLQHTAFYYLCSSSFALLICLARMKKKTVYLCIFTKPEIVVKEQSQFYFWEMYKCRLFHGVIQYVMNWHCKWARAAASYQFGIIVLALKFRPFCLVFLKPLQRK